MSGKICDKRNVACQNAQERFLRAYRTRHFDSLTLRLDARKVAATGAKKFFLPRFSEQNAIIKADFQVLAPNLLLVKIVS